MNIAVAVVCQQSDVHVRTCRHGIFSQFDVEHWPSQSEVVLATEVWNLLATTCQ